MIAFTWLGGFNDPAEAMLYDVASGEVISLGTELYVMGWSPDSRSIVSGENGVVAVVDVTDPTAPVVTEVDGLTEAFVPSWQPRPWKHSPAALRALSSGGRFIVARRLGRASAAHTPLIASRARSGAPDGSGGARPTFSVEGVDVLVMELLAA